MTTPDSVSLLDQDELKPVIAFNSGGRSPFLILGDHAGNAIPRKLSSLGLSKEDRERHIAWDIGVRGLGELLATALDAAFIHQHYSRLVIDCNRDPVLADAIPPISDGSRIPGNEHLSDQARERRIAEIHERYHASIVAELTRRSVANNPTILIALHSFTPVMAGIARPWHAGVLYSGGNTSFATALLESLCKQPGIIIGDNEPYQMDDTDHTVPRHAFANHIPYAELEIRQDLIAETAGQRIWSTHLRAGFEDTLHGWGWP
jgi:predicted N-formylglutamate amidohydrolase